MNVIKCEDSKIGILTAIYESYEWKCDPKETEILLSEEDNMRLFAKYYHSVPNEMKMQKVERTLLREFGKDFYDDVGFTLANCNPDKAQAVYQTIALGLTLERKASVMECFSNPWVMLMFRLSRNTMREHQHLMGFLRFEELDNGILYSRIGPKNHIIGYLAEHFSDRFPQENFMIYDEKRNVFAIHPKGKRWYYVYDIEDFDDSAYIRSADELNYAQLFRTFVDQIAIRERTNPNLQRNMLPLRFREYMTEFR